MADESVQESLQWIALAPPQLKLMESTPFTFPLPSKLMAGMMVLQLIWVKTMVPETKGVPLQEIQKQLGIA